MAFGESKLQIPTSTPQKILKLQIQASNSLSRCLIEIGILEFWKFESALRPSSPIPRVVVFRWVQRQTFYGFRPMVGKRDHSMLSGMKQRKGNTIKIRVSWRRANPTRIDIVEVRPSAAPNQKR